MRWFVPMLVAVFVTTLAVAVGVRSSLEWGPFLFGMLCGSIASVPASVLAFYLANGAEHQSPADGAAYAPLVIVNTPSAPQHSRLPDLPLIMHHESTGQAPRYRIVGVE